MAKTKTPAVVIVVRHGARLDAADKSWHLTSPTPYDPPLTYGGWTQSRALGLRIARLLREREKTGSSGASTPTPGSTDPLLAIHDFALHEPAAKLEPKPKKKARKHKVIIHSSPFQRCVQTSIGISAGLSQFQGLLRKTSDARVKSVSQLRNSPRLHAVDHSGSPKLQPVPEQQSDPRDYFRRTLKADQNPYKSTLRLDAFLGEWLSPGYFENITPPPKSTLMIAAAKGELSRTADHINTFTPSSPKPSGNLWGAHQNPRQHSASLSIANPSPLSHETEDGPLESPLENWRVLSRTLPRRTSSVGSGRKSPERFRSPLPFPSPTEHSSGYASPVPSYAISPGDPIPRGYVAHARDQCVDIDAKWDSMRDPHCWGDGGTFGEEWSQMHKRFRRGINHMVDWYSNHQDQTVSNGAELHDNDEHEAVPEADLEDDEDLVLVLVTHGAGCNALIGALTSQPVLLDFGLASLTMAVRKDDASPSNSENTPTDSPAAGNSPTLGPVDSLGHPLPRRRSSVEHAVSSLYDLKLVASTDHLRPGVDPARLSTPAMSSPALSASQTIPQSRSRRFGSASSHASAGGPVDANWNLPEPRARMNSALGSVRRASRPAVTPVYSSPNLGSAQRTDSPTGLWSPMDGRGSEPPSLVNPPKRANSSAGRLPTLQKEAIERSVSPKSVDATAKAAETDAVAVAQAVAGKDEEETKALLEEAKSTTSELPAVSTGSLGRGLWGSLSNEVVSRETGVPKRRWTVAQD